MPILIPLSPPHPGVSIFRKSSVFAKAPQIITAGFFRSTSQAASLVSSHYHLFPVLL